MLCYRTPESFTLKWTTNEELAILMLKVGCCIMAREIAAFSIGFTKNDESIHWKQLIRNRNTFENTIETEAEITPDSHQFDLFYSKWKQSQ
jgi:hypothetical protein